MPKGIIGAKITADNRSFKATLKETDQAATAWAGRMAGIGAQASKGAFKSSGASMGLLQIAQAADDAQYGLRGVLNNIPGLAMALGAGAGLAGAASLAALAISTLGKRIYDFATNAKPIKEATDELAKFDEKLKAASGRNAKEALEGTATGAQNLKAALAEADAAFADGNTALAARVALANDARDAELDLALARVEASDASESDKILERRKLELAALRELQSAEEARLKAEIRLHQERFTAAKKAADQAKAAEAAAQANLQGMGPGTNAFLRQQALDKAAAAAVDARKAQAELDRIDTASARATTSLTNQLNQKRETDLQRYEAMRESGEQRAAQARKKEMEDLRTKDAAQRKIEEDQQARLDALQKSYDQAAEALRKMADERARNLKALEVGNRVRDLRDQRRFTQADRLERGQRVDEATRQIQEDTGVSPDHARSLAEGQEGRRRGRINARSRATHGAAGIGGATFDNLDSIGMPRRSATKQSAGSREEVRRQENQGEEKTVLNEIKKGIDKLVDNTAGLAKGKSEPLAHA